MRRSAVVLGALTLLSCARPSAELTVPASVELYSWYVVDASGALGPTSPVLDLRGDTSLLELETPEDVVFVGYAAELTRAFDAASTMDRAQAVGAARPCDHHLPVTWAQRLGGATLSSAAVLTVPWLAVGCGRAGAWPVSLCGLAPECADSPCEDVVARVDRLEGPRLEAFGVRDAVLEASGTTRVALSGEAALARLEGSRVTATTALAGLAPLTSLAQSDDVTFLADRAGTLAMLDDDGRLTPRAAFAPPIRVTSRAGRSIVYGPTVAPRVVTTTTLSVIPELPPGLLALDHDGAGRLAYLTASGAVGLVEPGERPREVGQLELPDVRERPPAIALTHDGLVVGVQLDVRRYWAADGAWRSLPWVELGAGLEVVHLAESGGFLWGLGNGGLLFRYTAWRRCRVPLGLTLPLTALVARDGGEYEVFGGGLVRASFESRELPR